MTWICNTRGCNAPGDEMPLPNGTVRPRCPAHEPSMADWLAGPYKSFSMDQGEIVFNRFLHAPEPPPRKICEDCYDNGYDAEVLLVGRRLRCKRCRGPKAKEKPKLLLVEASVGVKCAAHDPFAEFTPKDDGIYRISANADRQTSLIIEQILVSAWQSPFGDVYGLAWTTTIDLSLHAGIRYELYLTTDAVISYRIEKVL